MSQLHKRFISEQVKEFFDRYSKNEIEPKYIQQILGIKKRRFFMLLKEYMGCEVGLYLAQKGKKVTIVEMTGDLASDLFADNRANLLQLLTEHKVSLLTETRLIEILDTGVVVNSGLAKRELKADTVVLALGLKPEVGLLRALGEKGQRLLLLGIVRSPGRSSMQSGGGSARLV
jgi:NAD(P)H-nitrite reductase large subunit